MAGPTPAKRAPRKATPAKAAPAKTSPAAPRVVLDLDTLSKDKAFPGLKLPKTPFTFLQAGVVYELRDPRDSDWKMALQLAGNPFLLMRTALVGADDPIDDPTEDEVRACRERNGLPSEEEVAGLHKAAEREGLLDGVDMPEEPEEKPVPALIDRFTASHLPGWKLNALFDRWHEHYKIDLKNGQGILAALLGKSGQSE